MPSNAANEFLSLADSGNYSMALVKLRHEVGMEEALNVCDQLKPDIVNAL